MTIIIFTEMYVQIRSVSLYLHPLCSYDGIYKINPETIKVTNTCIFLAQLDPVLKSLSKLQAPLVCIFTSQYEDFCSLCLA